MFYASLILGVVTILALAVAVLTLLKTPGRRSRQYRKALIICSIGTAVIVCAFVATVFVERRSTMEQGLDAGLGGSVGAGKTASASQATAIKAAVRNAAVAEFKAYQALPTINGSELKQYFVETGPAYQSIMTLLIKSQNLGVTLGNSGNASKKDIISVGEPIVYGDTAEVSTTEYWYLQWYSTKDQANGKLVASQPNNPHQYRLRYIGNTWKVESDSYKM